MINKLNANDVKTIASVIKIGINDEEAQKAAENINAMLDFAAVLDEADTSGVEPMYNPLDASNAFMRQDVVKQSLTQEEVLKAAANKEHGHFKVPKTIEG